MSRYTKKDADGRYYIESVNGKLESDKFGHTYGEAIDRFAELENADVVPRAEVEKIFKEITFVMKEYADRDIDEPELYARIGTIHRRFTKGENAQKDYFTPEEVRKMSQTEVRKNYQAITDSMKKW